MRRRKMNEQGSIYPVVIFFICLGLASFLVLIFGNVLTPFFQLLNSNDTTIDPPIMVPMQYMSLILLGFIWPKGVLAVILFGLIMWLLMDYQKNRYKETY
jgi:hypothetical protein